MIRYIKKKLKRAFKAPVKYGYKSPSAYVAEDAIIFNPGNLFIYDEGSIKEDSVILNARSKFIIKKKSHAAMGLRVFPGNHMRIPGKWYTEVTDADKDKLDIRKEYDQDVIVEEDVWIGAYVTLLNGVHIGRGCIVGSGSVVRGSTPPYSIIVGNPAKVVGFVFTPEEIIEHEKALYPEEERLPIELLEKNYNRYFLNRIKDIRGYLKL